MPRHRCDVCAGVLGGGAVTPAELQRQNASYCLHNGIGTVEQAIRCYLASYNSPHAKDVGQNPVPVSAVKTNSTAEPTQATRHRDGVGAIDLFTITLAVATISLFAVAWHLVLLEAGR